MKAEDLVSIGERLVRGARDLGAAEATARLSRSVSSTLSQRDGKLESFQESRSLAATVALLVDGRYSAHSTSDLRERAVDEFLARAVAGTRHLEVDPHRGLPDPTEMGAANAALLDLLDPAWDSVTPSERRAAVAFLEDHCREATKADPLRSITATTWDGWSERAMVTSNGFACCWAATSFGAGASVSLEEAGGRVPEAWSFHQSRHRADLPAAGQIGADAAARARRRLGSGPARSARYPMLLEGRHAGRLLGMVLGPLDGEAIFEGRSCMADRLGQVIAAPGFVLLDDPLVARGLGSRPHDGDGRPSSPRALIEDGRLASFLLGVYDGRRLGRPPTVGSTSNLVVPPGPRSAEAIAASLPRCVRVEGFLGGNSSTTTGDFSLGVHGTMLEHGQEVKALSEMNVSGNLFDLLARWVEAADDPWTHGTCRSPTLLFDDVQFSGS